MLSGYFDHGLGTVTSVTADNADSLAARDISMMRARIYAARTGAPNRARALQHLNAGVSEVSSRLPSYRRSHAIRGMKVPELISLRDQATNLLSAAGVAASTEREAIVVDPGMGVIRVTTAPAPPVTNAPTGASAEAAQLAPLQSKVVLLENDVVLTNQAIDQYLQARGRGTSAGHEDTSLDRQWARRIAPLVQRMKQNRRALDTAVQQFGNRHARWSSSMRSQATQWLSRASDARQHADAALATWRGLQASAYDNLNQTPLSRIDRETSLNVLRGVHSATNLQSGVARLFSGLAPRHIPWYYWAIGGAAAIGTVAVAVKLGTSAIKLTPQYRAVSMITGLGRKNPRKRRHAH